MPESSEQREFRVQVMGFAERDVTAETRSDAMEKAAEETDFGDLDTDTDEYRVERLGEEGEQLYNVYKNGELVEESKPMTDAKANRLDGHTQFNEDEQDFERFRVEEVQDE